jgi:chaperonin GroEL (HSP60 family)
LCDTNCDRLQIVKSIVDAGCKVVVTGGKVGELYLHYANKFGLMIVRIPTKFDLRRLCKSIGATPLPRLVRRLLTTCTFLAELFVLFLLTTYCL